MEQVISLRDVDLIYRSAESLSFKKIINSALSGGREQILSRYKALSGVTLAMEKGKVYGIIGSNGAGKSTLLRVLSGVMSPNSGIVERNYKTINLLALGVGFSKELTGYDNVFLNGMLLGFSKQQINRVKDAIIEYSEIGEFINRPMKTYSSGMVSRLGFAIAIHLKPEVLLIDEVLSVGDTKFREKSFQSIREIIRDEEITVAIVSHAMNQVESLCDRVIWLEKGKIVAQGETVDVLDLYNQHNAGKLTIEEIMRSSIDAAVVDGDKLTVNLADYSVRFHDVETKGFLGYTYDYIRGYRVGDCMVKITKRILKNDDIFLYFELENPKGTRIDVVFDEILEKVDHRSLYIKPPFDNRYGENQTSGLYLYLDLALGSAVVSKAYHFNRLTKDYADGGKSQLLELVNETDEFVLDVDTLSVLFEEKSACASFFVLLSKSKLFRDHENLNRYMEYYYNSVANNSVWCSYFMLPSGTQTKLPYSIEPFTKDGYGYSLHHSSRKDMFQFYSQTRERFFEDMISNAILQAYLYQNNEGGVFYTPYTSTWLKRDFGITAPYVDTRLNETFILMLKDFAKVSGQYGELDPQRGYVDYLCCYYSQGGQMYRTTRGAFFPDYFKAGHGRITHASLNHQLGISQMLLHSYQLFHIPEHMDLFLSMIHFVEDTGKKWVNPDNGDLYYSVKQGSDGLEFYGNDYVYVTLLDLLLVQTACIEIEEIGRIPVIDELIESKLAYLKTTEYDVFNPKFKNAPGEKIDSQLYALRLYKKLKE